MQCKKCGGTTKPNQYKKEAKHPDWICNQDNGECGIMGNTGYFMPTGTWNPRSVGSTGAPAKTNGYDADGQSQGNAKNKIGRAHV